MTSVAPAPPATHVQRARHEPEVAEPAPPRAPDDVAVGDWLKPALISGGITAAVAGGMLLQGANEFAQAGTRLGLTKPAIALGVLGPALVVGGIASWIAISSARGRNEGG